MKILKKNDGFTLVELSVAMTISLIILFAASGLLLSANSLFRNATMKSTAKPIGDAVYNYISEELIYAKSLNICTAVDENVTEKNYLTVNENGYLADESGTLIYPESFYQMMRVEVCAMWYGKSVRLVVRVLDHNMQVIYSTDSEVATITINLQDPPLAVDTAGGAINPFICYARGTTVG